MISYVAKEAAIDSSLTELSLRLLIFLGGENPHLGGWSDVACADLAERFQVSPKEILVAQHLLMLRGFLTRKVGTITCPAERNKQKHFFYSTDTRQ